MTGLVALLVAVTHLIFPDDQIEESQTRKFGVMPDTGDDRREQAKTSTDVRATTAAPQALNVA